MVLLRTFINEDDGQDMVEYGLVMSLIVIGGVTAYSAFSGKINSGINAVAAAVAGNL